MGEYALGDIKEKEQVHYQLVMNSEGMWGDKRHVRKVEFDSI